jgi:hypothetical protein
MRGDDIHPYSLFSYLSPEARGSKDHHLSSLRQFVNQALRKLSPDYQAMYSREGRPSIPPEKLLRASVLHILSNIRSVRLLMEQLNYNLQFRWLIGQSMGDRVWTIQFFPRIRNVFSTRTWPTPFSNTFRRRLRPQTEVDFHGERHLNRTHVSTIDPEARLLKKANGKEAKPSS